MRTLGWWYNTPPGWSVSLSSVQYKVWYRVQTRVGGRLLVVDYRLLVVVRGLIYSEVVKVGGRQLSRGWKIKRVGLVEYRVHRTSSLLNEVIREGLFIGCLRNWIILPPTKYGDSNPTKQCIDFIVPVYPYPSTHQLSLHTSVRNVNVITSGESTHMSLRRKMWSTTRRRCRGGIP